MPPKVRIIVNPVARTLPTPDRLATAPAWLRLRGWEVDEQRTERGGHAVELAREAAACGYDAVIAVSDGLPRAGLVTHSVMPIATVPVCAPQFAEGGKVDFASIPLLHARPRPDDWRRWLDHAQFTDVPVQGGSSFESLSLTIEAAAAGMGAAIAIDGLLAPDLARGDLVRAHPTVRPTRRQFVLEYEQRMADDPALTAFVAWLNAARHQPPPKKPASKTAAMKARAEYAR